MYAGNSITQSGKAIWLGTIPIEDDQAVRKHRFLRALAWTAC